MMGNTFQYYFTTWHENVRFLRDPDAQMGDKEVLAVFYAVGNATVNKRIVVPEPERVVTEPEFLVQLGDVEVWLPRSALALVGSRPNTAEQQVTPGALVKLVEKKKQLKKAFQALGSSSTVEMTAEKAAMCGCVGEVLVPDLGDGTLKIDFSGNSEQDAISSAAAAAAAAGGWYPASAAELVQPARGTTADTTSSMSSGAIGVGSQVRVRRDARVTLPVDAQVAAADCRHTGEVLAAPDSGPPPGPGGLSVDVPSSYGGSAYSGSYGSESSGDHGGIGSILRGLGKDFLTGAGGGGSGWPRRRRSGGGSNSSSSTGDSRRGSQQDFDDALLPAVEDDGRHNRRTSRKQQHGRRGGRRRGRSKSDAPPELFDLHLDRPLSRVADNLGMHYARKAAHVLNSPPPRNKRGAPSQIVGLRAKSLFGETSGGASSG